MNDIFCEISASTCDYKVCSPLKSVQFVGKAQSGGTEKGSAVLFGNFKDFLCSFKIRRKGLVYICALAEG